MSPAFSTRRRAEQFDALLDGTSTDAPSPELADLLALVGDIRSVEPVAPRPEFAASLRERLLAEAPEALAAGAAGAAETASRLTVHHRPTRSRRERRLALAAAALSIVGATGASAVASQGSVPGDTLYPVKRLIEDAKASLAMGDHARAAALLDQARTRLSEAHELATRDDVDTAAVTQALGDFADSADHASGLVLADYADNGDPQPVNELHAFSTEGVTTLSRLADVLPESLDGSLAHAVDTLLAIDHSATQACPSCVGGITELPSTLIDLLASTTDTTAATTPPGATATEGGQQAAPPSPVPTPSVGTQAGQLPDPLKNLTGGTATGAGQPGSGPTSVGGAVGDVGGAVGGTLGDVGGTVGDLGDSVGGAVGGTLGDVGGTLGDVGGTVDGTLGGVGGLVDGVLGGTPTPKP